MKGRIPERAEVDPRHTWNVEALYATPADWERDFAALEDRIRPLEAYREGLNGAASVAAYLEAETAMERALDKLYSYAHLRLDENQADGEAQERFARIRAKHAEVNGRLAWVVPELLSQPDDALRAWAMDRRLERDRYLFVKLLRQKPHTLSAAEETLLGQASDIFDAPFQIYGRLTNADIKLPPVKNAAGEEEELSTGRYIRFLTDPDRRVRRDAFSAVYDTYGTFRNTMAQALATKVRTHNYLARARRYGSALEAALAPGHIPVSLYDALVAAVRRGLPVLHRYFDLRRRRLGLDALDMCDLHVPIVPANRLRVPFEQAREWVVDACRPLGADYVRVLRSAFEDRWIDVYENRGKRSGAYSDGCHDSLPYILLNYQDTLDNVFTLAHELGHSMHSWLSRKTQTHRWSSYSLFVAEIASTLNEALLLRYLLETTSDPAVRAHLLNHQCEQFRATMCRQTMFAEFERAIHEMDAAGRPLTADSLSDAYAPMNAEYHGPAVKPDTRIRLEWSRIPHFFFNFYVYQYSTSFCASQIFVERVLAGGEGRDAYLNLLRAGGSDDPIELIRQAGVDMADPATYDGVFRRFETALDGLENALADLR